MKKSFDTWLTTAPTRDLEANLRAARNANEAARIREELKNRGAGLPDTGTMPLFKAENVQRSTSNAQRSITAAAILFCLATMANAAPRTPINNAYLQNDLDANHKKILNLDISGSGLQAALSFSKSVQNASGTVTLVGDTTSPGNNKVYSTNGSGVRGWNDVPSSAAGANPTASVGLTAVNGSALTFMPSDAAPALSQAIIPTWTGQHTWRFDSIGWNSQADANGILFKNTTTGSNQASPPIRFESNLKNGGGAGTNHLYDYRAYSTGTANGSSANSIFRIESNVDGGAYTPILSIFNGGGITVSSSASPLAPWGAGVVNVDTGFQIGATAPTGHYLRGEGNKYVDSAIQPVDVPTLNQNTTGSAGSAASLLISGQTGLLSFTGLASTNRAKTVRDAADTILELGGSYTPTGTWTNMTLVNPALGTPASGTVTNLTGTANININGTVGATTPTTGAFTTLTASTSLTLGTSGILIGGTNTIEQRNGTSGQTFQLYGTYSSSGTNYERLNISASTSEVLIENTQAGTGSARNLRIRAAQDLQLSSGSSREIVFQIAGTNKWKIDLNGNLLATTDNSYDIGASGATRPRDLYLGRNAAIGGTLSVTGASTLTGTVTTGGSIELGNASDTTLARVSAGQMSVEGVNISTVSSTDAFSNKTLDTASTNTIKRFDYLQLDTPAWGDGTNATRITADGANYGHFTFSNSVAKASNYVIYRFRIPDNLDTAIDLKAAFTFRLTNTDTGKHSYYISMADVATSASADAPTFSNEVAMSFAGDASGAANDIEQVGYSTLTTWKSSLTAGHIILVKVARDGNDGTLDTSTVNSTDANLTIRYAISSTSSQ